MRCKLFSLLLNVKVNLAICSESVVKELNAQLGAVDCFFDIQQTEEITVYDPHLKTGVNLLPIYQDWIGPEDMLNNITFGDFISCINLSAEISRAYQEDRTGDIAPLLGTFCRILYRHKDRKEEDTPALLNYHAYTFFHAVWELIRTVPIQIAGKEIDFSILFQEPDKTGKDDKTGWTGITFEVASSGVFGNVRQINRTHFWDVLLYLYKCRFDSIHLKTKNNEN